MIFAAGKARGFCNPGFWSFSLITRRKRHPVSLYLFYQDGNRSKAQRIQTSRSHVLLLCYYFHLCGDCVCLTAPAGVCLWHPQTKCDSQQRLRPWIPTTWLRGGQRREEEERRYLSCTSAADRQAGLLLQPISSKTFPGCEMRKTIWGQVGNDSPAYIWVPPQPPPPPLAHLSSHFKSNTHAPINLFLKVAIWSKTISSLREKQSPWCASTPPCTYTQMLKLRDDGWWRSKTYNGPSA